MNDANRYDEKFPEIYASFVNSIIQQRKGQKKFAFPVTDFGFKESEAPKLLKILQKDIRFTGLQFEIKKYPLDNIVCIRINWQHLHETGRCSGTFFGRSDCTCVGQE